MDNPNDVLEVFERLELLKEVPLSSLTTFHIGGPAELVFHAFDEEHTLRAVEISTRLRVPLHIMGNGSNILAGDEGLRGLVIVIGERMSGLYQDGDIFTAQAGMTLTALARETLEAGYMGLEWAAGIPGTVGGACAMNAGAYGGDISQRLIGVRAIENCELKDFSVSPDDMGYRYSAFCAPSRIVVSATFKLEPDDGHARERQTEYLALRREKQPLTQYSAGSTFKRPKGHYAGALIEGAGLKGVSVGGAMVSEKHAGFIVNTGEATCEDVLSLVKLVQDRVFSEYGVMLEPEVKIWR